ncbi:MAG TPA: aldehyde dehydrogenase family protein [Terriglobia bacterium]|nr:aldehyde dehydrogenase family protein [Terriglobia bacterium]
MSHCVQDPAATSDAQIQELITRARIAQTAFELFSQDQVDAIVKGIGKYVYDNAELLARMAVDETGIGVYEDKILKNKGKARIIWNNLKDKKSRGIIGEDPEANLVFVAKPMGVVAAVTPVTNPVVTPMCNAMFAVKTGNAVIFAPHPKAEKLTQLLAREFQNVVTANGGPDNLVQAVKNGTIETTQELMKVVDVIVATGGAAMVKSAYSSGKPSFGVGAGNVPVIIDNDADLKDAAAKIVMGASFDNGIICSHEQFVLVPEEKYDQAVESFEATGKVWFTEDEKLVQKFRDVVFPDGRLNKDVVGRSCKDIGAMAGVEISETVRIILLPAKGAGTDDVLAKEKLCPVVAILACKSFEEAVAKAKANLILEGAGHSAAVHSNNEANIRSAGLELPVSRLVVNQASSFTAGGSLTNGFAPTTTLGCGSWGGNSISENLDYKHLMNVSRIGKIIKDKRVPTDAEIWA